MLGVRKQDNFGSKLCYLVLSVTTDAIGNSQPAVLAQNFDMMQADHEAFCDCLFVAR